MSDLIQDWPEELQRELVEISSPRSWLVIAVLAMAMVGAGVAATLTA